MAGDKISADRLTCPGCKGSVQIYGLGKSCTIGCPYCGTIFDIGDSDYVLLKALDKNQIEPRIPLGTKGKFGEDIFQVIGLVVRTDGTGVYQWEEFLMFNPYKGFRWLVLNQGHWSFVTPVKPGPKESGRTVRTPVGDRLALKYEGKTFKQFLTGQAKVRYVIGEFYWQIRQNDLTDVADYIAPPFMLSKEAANREVFWSLGEYMTGNEIKAIFPNCYFPSAYGVAPHQPVLKGADLKYILPFMIITLVYMLVLQIYAEQRAEHRSVYSTSVVAGTAEGGVALPNIVTPTFRHDRLSNILVNANASVSNNWVEVDLSLVNVVGGEAEDVTFGIEYYHGVDSDGSWTEGSTTGSVYFPAVPAGDYYLTITPQAGLGSTAPVTVDIEVINNASYWGNFGLALVLVAVFPVCLLLYALVKENQRWQDSDVGGY